jgi:hypothetical protein
MSQSINVEFFRSKTEILENRVSPGSIVAAYFRARGALVPECIAAEWRRSILRRCKTIARRALCPKHRVKPSQKRDLADLRRRGAKDAFDVCNRCGKWRCVGNSKTCVTCTYCQ